MTGNLEQRVTRLEGSMEAIQATIQQLAQLQLGTQQQLDRVQQQTDRTQQQLDQTQQRINQLVENQEDLNADVDALLRMIRTSAEEGQRDREDIRAMQTEIRGLQLENRRILDYLLNQQQGGEGN